jgi:hypothetical protein
MTTTTIISSMSVKPFCERKVNSLLDAAGRHRRTIVEMQLTYLNGQVLTNRLSAAQLREFSTVLMSLQGTEKRAGACRAHELRKSRIGRAIREAGIV